MELLAFGGCRHASGLLEIVVLFVEGGSRVDKKQQVETSKLTKSNAIE
jgi:hypothetical protein